MYVCNSHIHLSSDQNSQSPLGLGNLPKFGRFASDENIVEIHKNLVPSSISPPLVLGWDKGWFLLSLFKFCRKNIALVSLSKLCRNNDFEGCFWVILQKPLSTFVFRKFVCLVIQV